MKVLDPGSTVREGEFANAENAGGVSTRVRNIWNKLQTGERVSFNRDEFIKTASSIYKAQEKRQEDLKKRFEKIAVKNNLDPENIFVIESPEEMSIRKQGISEKESIASEMGL
jgi:Holliday junction resolvase-like predicted endonuclease